jgi:hypothetical protein
MTLSERHRGGDEPGHAPISGAVAPARPRAERRWAPFRVGANGRVNGHR